MLLQKLLGLAQSLIGTLTVSYYVNDLMVFNEQIEIRNHARRLEALHF
jgi:hypothetical protein